MNSFSRNGLDLFLFENFFRGRRDGVFVDASAHNGGEISDTLFFERFLGWRGLCVQPDPQRFASLLTQRKCACEQAPPGKLAALLEKHALRQIDYCSIDAQGSELSVLSELDPSRIDIRLLSINNVVGNEAMASLLAERAYQLVGQFEGGCLLFKRREVRRLARTSVICAVWHGDADRHQLLEAHAQNLARQTVPVEPVYIFDGQDEPPASVPGHKVVAHENLSIYQAWNVGLAMVSTPFVMNLNLDDRLAPDAIELLENTLLRQDAALVGGEWKICYSQQETDAVVPVYPADQLPFTQAWPPPPGTRTRLGSGTGERGTLGPATLWRMDTHIGVPRYPWRFPDGTLVKVIGDMCWWTLVTQHLQKKAVRIADVIGNYHSHPGSQAEFRGPSNETALMQALGVSLF
jgi:hypothetical protein